jgi:hypothetical protein
MDTKERKDDSILLSLLLHNFSAEERVGNASICDGYDEKEVKGDHGQSSHYIQPGFSAHALQLHEAVLFCKCF